MKKTFTFLATETKSTNAKAAKAASKAASNAENAPKAEKTAKTEAAPKTVELPDPAKMTKDDYRKVSRKMRRLRRAGKTEEASKLAEIVESAKKNLGIGAKAEKTENAEKSVNEEKEMKGAAKTESKKSDKKSSK